MSCPDRKTVERLRAEYPVGCRIVLDEMDDKQAPKIGTQGTCMGVDDAGSIYGVAGQRRQLECCLRRGQLPPCGFGGRNQGIPRPPR